MSHTLNEQDKNPIAEYDLEADPSIGDHDAACVDQASRLLKVGCLEYETAVYALAFRRQGMVYFYLSDYAPVVKNYKMQLLKENIYSTPIHYFFKRYDLFAQSAEEAKQKCRLEAAQKIDAAYPPLFFDALEKLTAPMSANSSYPLLKQLSAQLENRFDLNHLHLFGDLLDRMFQARLLTSEGYQLFQLWLTNEYEKNAQDSLEYAYYKRLYAGFAYQKPKGAISYFMDAVRNRVWEKQVELIGKGYLVTPILMKTYYRGSYQALNACRTLFTQELAQYADDNYLRMMAQLQSLDAAVDEATYNTYQIALKAYGSQWANTAFIYYGHLWNVHC